MQRDLFYSSVYSVDYSEKYCYLRCKCEIQYMCNGVNLFLPSFSLLSLVSIIRGQVLTADGTPLIGVNVTFVHYPEHGYTVTRKDGMCVFIHHFYL